MSALWLSMLVVIRYMNKAKMLQWKWNEVEMFKNDNEIRRVTIFKRKFDPLWLTLWYGMVLGDNI